MPIIPTTDELIQSVQDQDTHPYYELALDRARTMNTWYESEFADYAHLNEDLFKRKRYVIKRSSIESNADYERKLDRMRLFPLENKFLASQKRIYDENNVDRQYPDDVAPFWKSKEMHYDDQGSSITEFYRDKVLFVKETLGFGAVVVDIAMNADGSTQTDDEGKPVPYAFTLRPHEVRNFGIYQGKLTFLISKQSYYNHKGEIYYRHTLYTPEMIYVFSQDSSDGDIVQESAIPNPFGEVPAKLIRGDVDATSSFNVGKPRRYSLKGLYLAASELFYDLQQGSELFGHPIPVIAESIAKNMAGVADDEQYNSETILEKVGMAIITPDDMPVSGNMLYQADMQGLQHLRDVVFKDLMSLIFNLAQVRDKSIVKSNVSGDAKFLDNVEEQGLLAQTAMDMEDIERDVMRLMAIARGEQDLEGFLVNYSKHYDLSSAKEIWKDLQEGLQYKGINLSTMKYLLQEYLRKRSAPQDTIDEIMEELNQFGMPKQPSDIKSLEGIVEEGELQRLAQPYQRGID